MSGAVIVNPELLQKVADELGLAASVVSRSVYRAINGVAAKTMTRSRRLIVSQVNLTQSYVRKRMNLSKANGTIQKAVISGRQRATRLATYGARQVTRKATGAGNAAKRAKSPAAKRAAMARYAASLTGDALRGIRSGQKASGVSVAVKRGGGMKRQPGAFLIPLQSGKSGGAGNGLGVFLRTGAGRKDIRHEYGPSVDDVLSGVIKDIEPEVQAELDAALLRQARYEFGRALGK